MKMKPTRKSWVKPHERKVSGWKKLGLNRWIKNKTIVEVWNSGWSSHRREWECYIYSDPSIYAQSFLTAKHFTFKTKSQALAFAKSYMRKH